MKSLMASLYMSLTLTCGLAAATEFRVLVVMSYEDDNPWVKEIREGGPRRAAEAFALFQSLQPDGVITADDDAQSMFVLPYLLNRTAVPIIFNGVNASADSYGFPSAHVSGILERAHVRESLAFIKQIVPAVRSACFMTADVPSGMALRRTLNAHCNVLFVDSLEGIADRDGKPPTNQEMLQILRHAYDRPILGGNRYQVEQGAWAAVVKTGQEQGELSATMLLQAMQGKPVSTLPVTQNSRGQRIINVTALERHGIVPRPTVLRGATLVRQQP
jgi:ABC-type uncharacterized transport system substrate-binding protein